MGRCLDDVGDGQFVHQPHEDEISQSLPPPHLFRHGLFSRFQKKNRPFSKVWVGSRAEQTDRQTNKQSDKDDTTNFLDTGSLDFPCGWVHQLGKFKNHFMMWRG